MTLLIRHAVTDNRGSDQPLTSLACLDSDLTCLDVYKDRDDCMETNWAIVQIILWSVNSRCWIALDIT